LGKNYIRCCRWGCWGGSAFVGVAAAVSPVLTPLGGAIVGAISTPGGVALGYAAGTEIYDHIFR